MAISDQVQQALDDITIYDAEDLDLSDVAISESEALKLAKALKGRSLQRINLNNCELSSRAVIAILNAIKGTNISEVNLDNNILQDESITALADVIRGTPSVASLSLNKTYLTAKNMRTLCAAIKRSVSLQSLYVSGNEIGDTGAKYVAEILTPGSQINNLSLAESEIGSIGASAIAGSLATNYTLNWLNLGGNPIENEGVANIAKALEKNKNLAHLNMRYCAADDECSPQLSRALRKNLSLVSVELEDNNFSEDLLTNTEDECVLDEGNKNLIYFNATGTASYHCTDNQLAVDQLVSKIRKLPSRLSAKSIEEINTRANAVCYTLDSILPSDEMTLLLSKVAARAEGLGLKLQLPPTYQPYIMPIHRDGAVMIGYEPEVADEEHKETLALTTASISKKLSTIASHNAVSTTRMIGHRFTKPLTLDEIEGLLDEAKKTKISRKTRLTEIQQARLELANNLVIPHIDYFIINASRNSDDPESIDIASYPNIKRVAGTEYDFTKLKQQVRIRESEASALNFDYLRDPTQGDHMSRLSRALSEVNGTIGQYESMFQAIERQVDEINIKIGQKRGLVDERGAYLREARKGNEFRTDRMYEYEARLASSLEAANLKTKAIGAKTAGQSAAMVAEILCDGIPILSGITKKVSQMAGVPDFGRAAHDAALTQAVCAHRDALPHVKFSLIYSAKQIDEGAVEREIATIKKGIEKLRENEEFKRFEQDKTKQKAVAEAFVNKLMLTFGKQMSEGLLAVCEEHGISKIDDFFDSFNGDPRLKESFTNLCLGYADSNDLSIIFAEVAAFEGDSPAHKAAAEYLERVLKPRIDDLYMHASKVDLIYQANMTGLGTDLHNARQMIRSEHDVRVGALFGDSFGVNSDMGALTVRGAVDVKNMFDYYMTRHGKTILTDTKIHDGRITGNTAPKGVSTLSDSAIGKHKELAIASRGYRQNGPDVSDMFLRICGYEYFRPQAPNGVAQGNIMANNPEAPASYQMANRVIQDFIKKLSFAHIDDYRAKVGTKSDEASKLDSLIAQTFMDFFAEVGSIHAADQKLGDKRANLKTTTKETGTFGFAFDSYERLITKDALGRFDLFLEIYKRNLEVQLRDTNIEDGKLLREQINVVAELTKQQLNPKIVEPGSDEHRHRARLANHTFENTHWRGAM